MSSVSGYDDCAVRYLCMSTSVSPLDSGPKRLRVESPCRLMSHPWKINDNSYSLPLSTTAHGRVNDSVIGGCIALCTIGGILVDLYTLKWQET